MWAPRDWRPAPARRRLTSRSEGAAEGMCSWSWTRAAVEDPGPSVAVSIQSSHCQLCIQARTRGRGVSAQVLRSQRLGEAPWRPAPDNGIGLRMEVGWPRGAAQRMAHQSFPGEISQTAECHMCLYINLLVTLTCFPLNH